MSASKDIPVCILAGGASRRFGSNKSVAMLGQKPLIAHVIDRISPQTQAPVAINSDNEADFAQFGLAILPDTKWAGLGPLSGVCEAMRWAIAIGHSQVATVAVDLPLLPEDLVERLASARAPSIATSNQRWHPVNGLWNVSQIDDLERYLESGSRSAHGWAERCTAKIVSFEAAAGTLDPFFNVNTPGDLERVAATIA